jgi:hypothetical protein
MKKLLRMIFGLVGFLALLIGVFYAVGLALPAKHTASGSAIFRASPETVWNIVTDYQNQTAWRKDLKEIRTSENGIWTEVSTTGDEISYRAKSKQPVLSYEVEIVNNSNFGGVWEFRFEPVNGGTKLTITEDGEIHNPFFRTIAKLFFDMSATINTYLSNLAVKLGEKYEK